MKYSLAYKGGRSRTAKDGSGTIVHAVPGNVLNGFWGTPAVCGAKHGQKGYGWNELCSEYSGGVTCDKCLKKITGGVKMADYKAFTKDKTIEIKNVQTNDIESADSRSTNSVVVLNEQNGSIVLVDNREFRIIACH